MSNQIKILEKVTGVAIKFNALISNDAFAYYTATAIDGNKHILDLKVNKVTMGMTIVFPDFTEVETEGRAMVKVENTPDGPLTRISSDSIKTFLYPRLTRYMAQYYISS